MPGFIKPAGVDMIAALIMVALLAGAMTATNTALHPTEWWTVFGAWVILSGGFEAFRRYVAWDAARVIKRLEARHARDWRILTSAIVAQGGSIGGDTSGSGEPSVDWTPRYVWPSPPSPTQQPPDGEE